MGYDTPIVTLTRQSRSLNDGNRHLSINPFNANLRGFVVRVVPAYALLRIRKTKWMMMTRCTLISGKSTITLTWLWLLHLSHLSDGQMGSSRRRRKNLGSTHFRFCHQTGFPHCPFGHRQALCEFE